MGRLERRLRALESRMGAPWRREESAAQEAIAREVMRRLTDEELDAYEAALNRMLSGLREEPTAEDEATLYRVNELYEEVERELAESPA